MWKWLKKWLTWEEVFWATIESCKRHCETALKTTSVLVLVSMTDLRFDLSRLSGMKSKVDELKAAYDREECPCLEEYDPHTVASLLKQYLRELPESLLGRAVAARLEDACGRPSEAERLQECQRLLGEVPAHTRLLLAWLITHMDHVIAREADTKMNIQNISIVLNPTVQVHSTHQTRHHTRPDRTGPDTTTHQTGHNNTPDRTQHHTTSDTTPHQIQHHTTPHPSKRHNTTPHQSTERVMRVTDTTAHTQPHAAPTPHSCRLGDVL